MSVVTRFAPSPTGMLHIGSARTALFNYLFAKHNNGKMLLRIEDTDKNRNSQEAVDAIINGLNILGIEHDGDIIFQSSRIEKHQKAVEKMLQSGAAYYAYDTQEELEQMKQDAQKNKINFLYNGDKWKNKTAPIPKDVKPVVRLNVPSGKTSFKDGVRGLLEFDNSTLDDLVLLRSDGTPTYMLSVVIDDIDMNITHVIRGDDHISNTPKQILIYQALNEEIPSFSHIPMIHDIQGKKLSKRKNAVAVEDYIKDGYLPNAIVNYLLHLGWNDGTEKEIYTKQEAIDVFSIERIGKSPSKFDFNKLKNINLHYINKLSNESFVEHLMNFYLKYKQHSITMLEKEKMFKLVDELKKLSTLEAVVESFNPLLDNFSISPSIEDISKLRNNRKRLLDAINLIKQTTEQDLNLKILVDAYTENNNVKIAEIAQLIRFCLVGKWHSFGIYKLIETLTKEDIQKRLRDIETFCNA